MRTILANRRHSEAFDFTHDGIAYRAAFSRAEILNGPVMEVFLEGGKPGSSVQALARDCAVLASLALQYGCPLETIHKALTRVDDDTPAGPMGRFIDIVRSA
jgi:hypothetical protein